MKNILLTATIFVVTSHAIAQSKTTLTALFDKNTKNVKLRWQNIDDVLSFSLQSSKDNNSFKDIFNIKASEVLVGDFIKYNDNNLFEGKNYYRLKICKTNNRIETSSPLMIIGSDTEDTWLVYPVPVGQVINLQYTGNNALDGVVTV